MDFLKYLERFKVKEIVPPTLSSLYQLQKNHLLNIPFENLNIHYGIPIVLDLEKIYHKIVVLKRGGFCYELNGLFFELLQNLGFDTYRISARVYDKNNGYGKEHDHLAIIVNINGGQYLTDVGFGEFCRTPLKLELETVQKSESGGYVFDMYEKDYWRTNKIVNGKLIPQYIFQDIPRKYEEFSQMCQWHQTSVDSHFTHKRLATVATENGRITITGDLLKIRKGDFKKEIKLDTEQDFKKALKDYFRIESSI